MYTQVFITRRDIPINSSLSGRNPWLSDETLAWSPFGLVTQFLSLVRLETELGPSLSLITPPPTTSHCSLKTIVTLRGWDYYRNTQTSVGSNEIKHKLISQDVWWTLSNWVTRDFHVWSCLYLKTWLGFNWLSLVETLKVCMYVMIRPIECT